MSEQKLCPLIKEGCLRDGCMWFDNHPKVQKCIANKIAVSLQTISEKTAFMDRTLETIASKMR